MPKFNFVKAFKRAARNKRLETEFMVGRPRAKAIETRPSNKKQRKQFKQNRHLTED